MKTEKLINALGKIDDKYLSEAEDYVFRNQAPSLLKEKNRRPFIYIIPAAAAAAVIFAAAGQYSQKLDHGSYDDSNMEAQVSFTSATSSEHLIISSSHSAVHTPETSLSSSLPVTAVLSESSGTSVPAAVTAPFTEYVASSFADIQVSYPVVSPYISPEVHISVTSATDPVTYPLITETSPVTSVTFKTSVVTSSMTPLTPSEDIPSVIVTDMTDPWLPGDTVTTEPGPQPSGSDQTVRVTNENWPSGCVPDTDPGNTSSGDKPGYVTSVTNGEHSGPVYSDEPSRVLRTADGKMYEYYMRYKASENEPVIYSLTGIDGKTSDYEVYSPYGAGDRLYIIIKNNDIYYLYLNMTYSMPETLDEFKDDIGVLDIENDFYAYFQPNEKGSLLKVEYNKKTIKKVIDLIFENENEIDLVRSDTIPYYRDLTIRFCLHEPIREFVMTFSSSGEIIMLYKGSYFKFKPEKSEEILKELSRSFDF